MGFKGHVEGFEQGIKNMSETTGIDGGPEFLISTWNVTRDIEIILETQRTPDGYIGCYIHMDKVGIGAIAACSLYDVLTEPESFLPVHETYSNYIQASFDFWKSCDVDERQPLINVIEHVIDGHGELPEVPQLIDADRRMIQMKKKYLEEIRKSKRQGAKAKKMKSGKYRNSYH